MGTYSIEKQGQMTTEQVIKVITENDLSSMPESDRPQYIFALAKNLGLDPLTKPIQVLRLDGKLVAYFTRGATDQLAKIHNVSTRIIGRLKEGDVYVAHVMASTPDGRFSENIGGVPLTVWRKSTERYEPASPTEVANAMMKAITKAQRRAVLSLIGLGAFMAPEEAEDMVEIGSASHAPMDATPIPAQTVPTSTNIPTELMESVVSDWVARWESAGSAEEFNTFWIDRESLSQDVRLNSDFRKALDKASKRLGLKYTMDGNQWVSA